MILNFINRVTASTGEKKMAQSETDMNYYKILYPWILDGLAYPCSV